MNIKSSMILALPGIFGSTLSSWEISLTIGSGGVGEGGILQLKELNQKRGVSPYNVFDLTDTRKEEGKRWKRGKGLLQSGEVNSHLPSRLLTTHQAKRPDCTNHSVKNLILCNC